MIDVYGFWHDDEDPNTVWAPTGGMNSPVSNRGYVTSDDLDTDS